MRYRSFIMQWHEKVRIKKSAHIISAQVYELWYNIIGFAAIFAAIIAGYQVTQQGSGPLPFWTILLGVFAIMAAVSNAALKFFGFENRKQKHQTAASHYSSLQYEMERWLMASDKEIPTEVYDRITNQLMETDKNAPLIANHIYEKAKNEVQNQAYNEIPEQLFYDIELIERWKIEDGKLIEIGDNPVRSYICEPLEMLEYRLSRKIIFNEQHIMIREGDNIPIVLNGNGIIDNNIAFIQYSVLSTSTANKTYGTMTLAFTNRIEAEGYWMTANVKGANFLLGTIKMELRGNDSQEQKVIQ